MVSDVIELQLVGVRVELPTNQPIVLLKEREGERYLPIWIGPVEATAIALGMQGIETQRPMTHDLMRDLLQGLGVSVDRIVITELREGTFYAEIQMSQNGDKRGGLEPARPTLWRSPCGWTSTIFAEEEVLDEASIAVKDDEEAGRREGSRAVPRVPRAGQSGRLQVVPYPPLSRLIGRRSSASVFRTPDLLVHTPRG